MQLQFFGQTFGKNGKNSRKIGHLSPWWMAAIAAGILSIGGGGVLITRTLMPRQDLAATVAVEAKTMTARISASGQVLPIQTVNLSPKTAGRIAELLVDQGDRVTQGQIVARMDNQDLEAERAQATARVAEFRAKLEQLQAGTRVEEIRQAEAEVARAAGEIDRMRKVVTDAQSGQAFAQSQAERQRQLASQGAISTNALDEFLRKEQTAKETLGQTQAQLAQAQAQYTQVSQQLEQRRNGARPEEIAQVEAQVAGAIAQLRQVENKIEDTLIRAPFTGVVTQRYATVGAFVTPTTQASATTEGATSTSIFALADGLEVKAKVPEVDIGQIKPQQTVDIRVDAYPEETFKGKVRRVAPEAITDRDVTSFEVRIEMLTGQQKLRSKMNADVNFLGDSIENALAIPTAALSTRKGKTGVWVPGEGDKPKFQPVTTGLSFGNETQILEGIKSGDRIFLQPPRGQKIKGNDAKETTEE